MKKLKVKDEKVRINFLVIEDKYYILKSIFKNANLLILLRWNAFLQLKNLINKNVSKISSSNRCLVTTNKKRFNKLTSYSRQIFLKFIRAGMIPGIRKSIW